MSSKRKRIFKTVLIVLIVLTLAFIWGNSLLDRENSTKLSNGLLEFLKPIFNVFGITLENERLLRKIAHFAEFALLGAELWMLYLLGGSFDNRSFMGCAGYCLFAAVVDEGIQSFSGRASSMKDVMLDLSGALAGMCVVSLAVYFIIRHKEKNV